MKYFTHALLLISSVVALDVSAGMNGYILPPAKRSYKPQVKKVSKVEVPTDKETNSSSPIRHNAIDDKNLDDIEYVKRAKESSVAMLIKASAMYRDGKISKDKYIEVALQTSQMADYYEKLKANPVGRTQDITAAVPSGPVFPSIAVAGLDVIHSQLPSAPAANQEYDPVTKIVTNCSEYSISRGCKVGSYRSNVGGGGYFPLPDPVITVNNTHPRTASGQKTNISWNVSASAPVTCNVIDDDTKGSVYSINGAGSWESPAMYDTNKMPAKTYTVKCSYASGQYSYDMVQVFVTGPGTAYDRVTASSSTPAPAPAAPVVSDAPHVPSFLYGNSNSDSDPKLKINGGGSCTPYPVTEAPNCYGGCGPCEANNTHPAKPSTWSYVGAGISGGCKSGFKLVWANASRTGFNCEAEN